MLMEAENRTRLCIVFLVLIAQTLAVVVLPVAFQQTSSNTPGYMFAQTDAVSISLSNSSSVLLESSSKGLALFKRSGTPASYGKVDSKDEVGIKAGVVNPSGTEAAVRYEVGGVPSIKIFDISANTLSNSYNAVIPTDKTITAFEYLDDNKLIIGLSNGKVACLSKSPSSNQYSVWKQVQFHPSKVLSISTNGSSFISTSTEQVVWGTVNSALSPAVSQTQSRTSVTSAAISPNGKRALIGYEGGSVEMVGDLSTNSTPITSFSGQVVKSKSDGSQFAALSSSGVLRIWGQYDTQLSKSDFELTDVVGFSWINAGEIYVVRSVNDADQGQLYLIKIDCSQVDNSATTAVLQECTCNSGYYFKDNVCNRNCSQKPLEDGTNYNKDTCNCIGLATIVDGECQLDCSSDSNAVAGITTTKCTCLTGYSWTASTALCTRNCTLVSHSENKTVDGSATECVCSVNYTWLDTECVVDCDLIPNADTLASSTTCACDTGYIWESGACVVDCKADEYSTGSSTSSGCECLSGYFWQTSTQQCTLNCSNVKYTESASNPSAGECDCRNGFAGDLTTGSFICKPMCTEQVGSSGYSDTGLECVCSTGYKWSDLGCIVDCSKVANSNGLNDPTDYQACQCKTGYVSVDSSCYLDCSVNEFSYDIYTNNSRCNCTSNAISSDNSRVCLQNCATLPNANASRGTNEKGQCYCKTGYYYGNSQCVLNCTIDSKSDSTNFDINTCNCLTNYTWNSDKCFTDCRKVSNSMGFLAANKSACSCADGYGWSNAQEICVSSSGDGGSSGTAIGLGVGLGVGIPVLLGALAGVYFLFRRKRNRARAPPVASPYYQPAQTATTFQAIGTSTPVANTVAAPLAQSMAPSLGGSFAGQGFYPLTQSYAQNQSSSQANNSVNTCMVCQGPEANMLTSCGHKFHVQCMMTRMRQVNQGCPACGYKNFYILKGDM